MSIYDGVWTDQESLGFGIYFNTGSNEAIIMTTEWISHFRNRLCILSMARFIIGCKFRFKCEGI